MKKIFKLFLSVFFSIFLVSCGDKNVIPKEYLGSYKLLPPSAQILENGEVKIDNDNTYFGEATLKKDGDRYVFKIKTYLTDEVNTNKENDPLVNDLVANVKIKTIEEEKGEFREEYFVSFYDYKITGQKNINPASLWNEWNHGNIKVWFIKEKGRYIFKTFGDTFIKVK